MAVKNDEVGLIEQAGYAEFNGRFAGAGDAPVEDDCRAAKRRPSDGNGRFAEFVVDDFVQVENAGRIAARDAVEGDADDKVRGNQKSDVFILGDQVDFSGDDAFDEIFRHSPHLILGLVGRQ